MFENLKKSLIESPVVKKGDYDYFVHPVTDGVPLVRPEILEEVADGIAEFGNMKVDKIVCVEAMGIHIATALSLKTGTPFVVVRKRSYGLDGEVAVHQVTGYSEAELYINGLSKGDKIILVDDVVSTGGTMISVIQALETIGVEIVDVVAVIEKGRGKYIVEDATNCTVKSLVKVNVRNGKVVIEGSVDEDQP
jgi:adenine phosphoribosyltransferase